MNLRTIIIGLAAISSVGLVVACSSSSTTNNTVTTKDGGGGGGGGGEGGGGGDTDGGGGGGGGDCKLADGDYAVTTKATPGNDVDAASPAEAASCKDSTSTITIDSTKDANSGSSSCTTMLSADMCTATIDCTSDSNGYKTTIHIVEDIDPSGTSFKITTTSKTVQDDGGAALIDCTTVATATKM